MMDDHYQEGDRKCGPVEITRVWIGLQYVGLLFLLEIVKSVGGAT